MKLEQDKERYVYATIWERGITTYLDQTGRFRFMLYRSNAYVMALVQLDLGANIFEPLKNKSAEEMMRAYLVLVACLKKEGMDPEKRIMEN